MAPLSSYLIMPIQRIPRYKLLLETLIENTHKRHPDFSKVPSFALTYVGHKRAQLSEALGLVKEVATHINQAVRAQQNNETILAIQSQFTSNVQLLAPG